MVGQRNSKIFVGFAQQPGVLADTIRSASNRIGRIGGVDLQTWEDLRIGGTIVVDRIEAAIRGADLAIFDLTQLNENVLYVSRTGFDGDRFCWFPI